MTDPLVNQINSISQIDATSDVAGGAAVAPSYILSDVPSDFSVGESVGIDSIEVSTGVSTSQINLFGTNEKEESANYIKSDVSNEPLVSDLISDSRDMNSIDEIEKASKYITPGDAGVLALLATLKDTGVITDSMSQDEMALAIHSYITANFSYQAEAVGDDWQTASETIKNGGGDCEDLANLEASILTAALIDKGLSLEEASKRVSAVVVGNINTGTGHVYVQYVGEDGGIKCFDPSIKSSTGFSLVSGTQTVLFTYNAGEVKMLDVKFNYSKLITAGYVIPTSGISLMDGINAVTAGENRLGEIQRDMWKLVDATNFLATQATVVVKKEEYKAACDELETAQNNWTYSDLGGPGCDTMDVANQKVDQAYTDIDLAEKAWLKAVNDYTSAALNIGFITPAQAWEINNTTSFGLSVDNIDRKINQNIWLAHYDEGALGLTRWIEGGGVLVKGNEVMPSPSSGVAYGVAIQHYSGNHTITDGFFVTGGTATHDADGNLTDIKVDLETRTQHYDGLGNYTTVHTPAGSFDLVSEITSPIQVSVGWDSAAHQPIYQSYDLQLQWIYTKNSISVSYQPYDTRLSRRTVVLANISVAETCTRRTALLDSYLNTSAQISLTYKDILSHPPNQPPGLSSNAISHSLSLSYIQSKLTVQDPATGYYSLNQSDWLSDGSTNPLLALKYETIEIKGMLMIYAIIYEALRGLRDLVNQELRGADEGGYKGMDIPKLFAKKVQRYEQSFQTVISNVLKMMDALNQHKYNQKKNDINEEYDARAQVIQDRSGNIFRKEYWEGDRMSLQNEKNRVGELKAAADEYKAAMEQSRQSALTAFQSACGSAGYSGVTDTLNGLNSTIVIDTPDATDGRKTTTTSFVGFRLQTTTTYESYKQIDYDQVETLRKGVVGAGQQIRIGLMAKEALANMRNLVHQEMTGIGGRQMRTDITSVMVETEQKNILMWFDQTVDCTARKVQAENQSIYYQINLDKIQKQIDQIKRTTWLDYAVRIITAVFVVGGAILGGFAGAAIGGLVGQALSGIFGAARNAMNAVQFNIFENQFDDVMRPTEYHYRPNKSNVSTNEDAATNTSGQSSATTGQNGVSTNGQLTEVASQLNEVTSQLNAIASQPDAADSQLTEVASQLNEVTSQLNAIASQPDATVSQLTEIASQLTEITTRLNTAATQPGAAVSQLTEVASQLTEVASQLNTATGQTNTATGQSSATTGQPSVSIGNTIINTVYAEQNSIEDEAGTMDAGHFVVINDNGHNDSNSFMSTVLGLHGQMDSFEGSSTFNSASFGAACDRISAQERAMMVLNSIRSDVAEMRNLVHMEMTGIGGRSPSNMVTYAMEAARGQMAFVTSLAEMSIMDQTASKNAQYQRNRRLLESAQNVLNGLSGLAYSLIPVVGRTISKDMDLRTKRRNYQEMDHAELNVDSDTASYDFGFDAVNSLLDGNCLVDAGGGRKAVDYNAISAARNIVAAELVKQTVLAAIQKAKQDLRALVHMEMTGIDSRRGGDMPAQVSAAAFESAMKSIDMIANFLSEQAKVHNDSVSAQNMVDKLETQIKNNITSGIINIVSQALAWIPGAGAVAKAALQLLAAASSLIFGILDAKSEMDYANRIIDQGNTGALQGLVNARKIMDNSVNSTRNRLEELEQKCMEEINNALFENLGGGNIGVNNGLAAGYKNALEKAYRAEKTIQMVEGALNELRNMVHQVMTGISGLSSDATTQALSMELKKAQSKIDDAFRLLDALAQRKNEINEAEKMLARAEVQKTKAIITGTIQCVLAVVNMISALKNADLAKEAARAEKEYNNAKKNVKNAEEAANGAKSTEEVAAARKGLNAANNKLASAEGVYNISVGNFNAASAPFTAIGNAIMIVNIAANLALTFYQKDQLEKAESRAEAKVAKSGVTSTPKTSKVVASEMQGGASMEDYTAMIEAESGADSLRAQANKYKLEKREIKREFKQGVMDWAKDSGMELLQHFARMEKINKNKTAYKPVGADAQASSGTVGPVAMPNPEVPATPAQQAVQPSPSVVAPSVPSAAQPALKSRGLKRQPSVQSAEKPDLLQVKTDEKPLAVQPKAAEPSTTAKQADAKPSASPVKPSAKPAQNTSAARPEDVKLPTARKTDSKPVDPDSAVNKLKEEVKKLQANPNNVAAVVKAAEVATSAFKQARQANTSNALAYADMILDKMSKSMTTESASNVNAPELAQTDEKKELTIKELKEALQAAREKLADAGKKLADAIMKLADLKAKTTDSSARAQLEGAEKKLKEEQKEIVKELKKIEQRLNAVPSEQQGARPDTQPRGEQAGGNVDHKVPVVKGYKEKQ